jgi:hypothetical protein
MNVITISTLLNTKLYTEPSIGGTYQLSIKSCQMVLEKIFEVANHKQ